MELLKFYLAIFLIITFLFYSYFQWRLWPKIWAKIWGWVLSERKKRGLKTASLKQPMEGKSSSASIIEAGKDSKNRKLIRIVISHLVLYLFVLLLIMYGFTQKGGTTWFTRWFWLWDTRYISPTVRNIILLVIVIIVFPLVSVVYELERRKWKKKADIQNKKNPSKIKQ